MVKHLERIHSTGNKTRAAASLTVPGGQGFHFPHFFLTFRSIFLIFPQTLLIFSLIWPSGWASRPSGKALATPLNKTSFLFHRTYHLIVFFKLGCVTVLSSKKIVEHELDLLILLGLWLSWWAWCTCLWLPVSCMFSEIKTKKKCKFKPQHIYFNKARCKSTMYVTLKFQFSLYS